MKKTALSLVLVLLSIYPISKGNSVPAGPPQKIVDNVYHLTDQDFDQHIKRGVVMVDFWAVWCGPCRIQGPIVDEIAQEIGHKTKIAKVDVDQARLTANRYNIRYIPTIIIFKDGEPVLRLEGLQQKESLMEAIQSI